jgi:hypothetical protein
MSGWLTYPSGWTRLSLQNGGGHKFDVQQQYDLSSAIFRGYSNWFNLKFGLQQHSSGFRLLKGHVGIFC